MLLESDESDFTMLQCNVSFWKFQPDTFLHYSKSMEHIPDLSRRATGVSHVLGHWLVPINIFSIVRLFRIYKVKWFLQGGEFPILRVQRPIIMQKGVLCLLQGPLQLSPILFNRPSELSKTIGWTFHSMGTFQKIYHCPTSIFKGPRGYSTPGNSQN